MNLWILRTFAFNVFFGKGKIQGTTSVEKVQISGIPWQSSSQDSALSWLRTQVQFPGWRTVPQATGCIQEEKKKKRCKFQLRLDMKNQASKNFLNFYSFKG